MKPSNIIHVNFSPKKLLSPQEKRELELINLARKIAGLSPKKPEQYAKQIKNTKG